MSANNFILISQVETNLFMVEEMDMESEAPLENIGDYKHPLAALIAAGDFMEENEVEGGIVFRKYTP